MEKNIWTLYFLELYDTKLSGETWIDFEKEISLIIESLDEFSQILENTLSDFFSNAELSGYLAKKFVILNKSHKKNFKINQLSISLSEFRDILFHDLQKLTEALEIYLFEIVEKQPIVTPEIILNIKPEKIISFNYTHTSKKVYPNAEVIYIHGESKKVEPGHINNMVMGIDEYWNNDVKDIYTNYAIFKKFVQRIQKRNIRFKDEMFRFELSLDIYKNVADVHLHIYGHSLDATDKDILIKILLNKYVEKIIIYCLDSHSEGKYISNIIKIVGQNKLLEWVDNEKIEFKLIPKVK